MMVEYWWILSIKCSRYIHYTSGFVCTQWVLTIATLQVNLLEFTYLTYFVFTVFISSAFQIHTTYLSTLVNLPQTWTLCYGLGRGALLSLPLVATTFRWSIRLPLSLRGGSCSRALRQSAPTTHRDEQRSQHYCNQKYVNSYDVLTKLI